MKDKIHIQSFNEHQENLNISDVSSSFNKPLTIKELKERLEFLLKDEQVSENDYVFYHLPDEDEGSYESLRPVSNIGGPNLKFFHSQKDILEKLVKMEGVQISFLSPNVRDKRLG
jgi:hypothetical protein